ncbi:MAG: hypothetical protein U9R56_07155, partial [candidate division Zixibacteria bacterium]|nr:hypothetical protein [candidate division Zixibacteria bacterium]
NSVGYGPYETVTNGQGVASVSIHSGTRSGTIRIRASSDEVLSNATQVMVSAGPPYYIDVAAEECNVDYWDNVGNADYSQPIVAVVSDIYLNPVNDSTVVYFTTDEGSMKSHEERTGDLEGVATTLWIAARFPDDRDGWVEIYAETAGKTVADTGYFFNTHFPAIITATGAPSSMAADSRAQAYVWVSAVDLNGHPVIGGTQFNADASYLLVSGGTFEDGCYSASDRVEIGSVVLDNDYSLTGVADDGIGAIDVVTYWHAAGASVSFNVTMTTGYTYTGNSSLVAQGSPKGGETAYFTATVKDRAGNPLGDHGLQIEGGSTILTNSYGEAYFSAVVPGAPGDYTYAVTDNDPRGNNVVLTCTITVDE